MKLSVITINYNNAHGLERTIKSIIGQGFKDFEYIIIDGGSTDDSVDIIKKYENNIDYWVSEKDSGVYNAMNKGIKQANGLYLYMLNSGDCLFNDTILESVFKHELNEAIIYGNLFWDENGTISNQEFPKDITFEYFRWASLGHQAAFIKKSLHNLVGLYDERFKIVSDWKFFLIALCKFNVSHLHIPLFISICGRDGLSCKPENLSLIEEEKKNVFLEEFPYIYPDYINADKKGIKLRDLGNNRYVKIARRLKLIKD